MRYFVAVKNYYSSTKDSLNLAYAFYDFGKIYAALNVPEIPRKNLKKVWIFSINSMTNKASFL